MTCEGLKDVTTLRALYCALVSSQLEYCTVVWSPYTARNINKLEGIQRIATKFILKTDDDYDTRRERLKCYLKRTDVSCLMYCFCIRFLMGIY